MLASYRSRKRCQTPSIPSAHPKKMKKKINVETSGSYSIKGPLGVISLCGPEE
jgi:hypothetical protein